MTPEWTDIGTFTLPVSLQIEKTFDIPEEPMNAPETNAATTATVPVPAANPITSSLLHDLVLTGLTAASIFIKNPASQQAAGSLINLVNAILKEHGQSL